MKKVFDFFKFKIFVAPGLIKFTFWLSCLGSVVACVQLMRQHQWLQACSVLLVTPLFVRLCCEVLLGVVQLGSLAEKMQGGCHDSRCD